MPIPRSLLIDPDADPGQAVPLHLPADVSGEDALSALHQLLQAQPSADNVLLITGGVPIGVSSRRQAQWLRSWDERGLGDGDGAGAMGEPIYEALLFRCGSCGLPAWRIHVDADDLPRCPDGHGPMEPAR